MRQLRIADQPCAWCGRPVFGYHRDRELCSRECFLMRRGWRALIALRDRGADDVVLDREFAVLQSMQDRFYAGGGVRVA
jgi:hypothetical protein